jgi:hypothetical protein
VLKAAWRLCRHQQEGTAELILLDAVCPKKREDPVALSERTHAQIATVLEEHHAFTTQPPPYYKE